MKAHGTVHKYGDNVDTDVIIPLMGGASIDVHGVTAYR